MTVTILSEPAMATLDGGPSHLSSPVEVVMPSRHDALGIEAAAGLDVRDVLPATVRIRREVSNRVEEPSPPLAIHLTTCRQVLPQGDTHLRVVEIGETGRCQNRGACDVMEVSRHEGEIGSTVILHCVCIQLIWEGGTMFSELAIGDSGIETSSDQRR